MARLAGNWQFYGLTNAQKFIRYAYAYLSSAKTICTQLQGENPQDWARANVILLLTVHSIELFLKGSLMRTEPAQQRNTHNIINLADQYNTMYGDNEELRWDVPFTQNEIAGLSEEEAMQLIREMDDPSIRYRYPTDSSGNEWQGLEGFDSDTFMFSLNRIKNDFTRIESILFS